MKIFSMKKTVLGLLLLAGVALNSNAVEIGIGVRVGFENEFTTRMEKNSEGTFGNAQDVKFGAAMQAGLFADIGLTEWFAITPGVNVSLFRGVMNKTYGTDADGNWDKNQWSSASSNFMAIDVDLLAKLMYGNWYGAVGVGMTFTTAPTMTFKDSDGSSEKFNSNATSRISMNIVMDTGLYFPLMDSENHFLITGIRTTYDVFALFAKEMSRNQAMKAMANPYDIKFAGASPFTAAFTVGYMFKFA
ncbi:outer membrane beta-barrel protein [Entomospira culicis]|uniref:PorT family protein n=1 Tax=Entomospira culicis TaxID=2719989 RepID=A0A968GGQ2_9SPIO|nr:outer membrane beta-barrel protein [Entomospira culicis]NIZ18468.1 PorT family protein [Entomospira culicis]NIZ68684.1 PorT family protein [Entomospira culicis]WDI37283.1 outer membrane beta-barrel protein [Entomospira culicis]WDI38912.1 outer membrane beta-barrel protein [Entomospira culicis]